MATRCMIRIHNSEQIGETDQAVLLYHHQDGMPDRMLPKLHKMLAEAYELLRWMERDYWWDAEHVAALLVALSADTNGLAQFAGLLPVADGGSEDGENREAAMPEFLPCGRIHGDCEYVYDVRISPVSGSYRIDYD